MAALHVLWVPASVLCAESDHVETDTRLTIKCDATGGHSLKRCAWSCATGSAARSRRWPAQSLMPMAGCLASKSLSTLAVHTQLSLTLPPCWPSASPGMPAACQLHANFLCLGIRLPLAPGCPPPRPEPPTGRALRASCPPGKGCGPEGPQTPAETGSPSACCACEAALQAAASLRLAGSPCPLSCRRTLSAAGRMLWASWRPRERSSVRTIGTQRERQRGGLLPAGSTWPYRGVVRCSSRRLAACTRAGQQRRRSEAMQPCRACLCLLAVAAVAMRWLACIPLHPGVHNHQLCFIATPCSGAAESPTTTCALTTGTTSITSSSSVRKLLPRQSPRCMCSGRVGRVAAECAAADSAART